MIYYVRHGETDFNLFGVTQGQLDTSLNKMGLLQASQLAEKLKNYKFDYIFSSPLTRCKQTLEAIQVYHKDIKPVFDDRLMEVSKGILQGQKNSKEVYQDFFRDPHKYGGETEEEVYNRVLSFLEDIEDYKSKTVLVVGHGGILKYLQFCLAGKDIKRDKLIISDLENCKIMKLNF